MASEAAYDDTQNASQNVLEHTVNSVACGRERYVTVRDVYDVLQARNREYRWKHAFRFPEVLRNLPCCAHFLGMNADERGKFDAWIKADCAETAFKLKAYVDECRRVRLEEARMKSQATTHSKKSSGARNTVYSQDNILQDVENTDIATVPPDARRQISKRSMREFAGFFVPRKVVRWQQGGRSNSGQSPVQAQLPSTLPPSTVSCVANMGNNGFAMYPVLMPLSEQNVGPDPCETVYYNLPNHGTWEHTAEEENKFSQ